MITLEVAAMTASVTSVFEPGDTLTVTGAKNCSAQNTALGVYTITLGAVAVTDASELVVNVMIGLGADIWVVDITNDSTFVLRCFSSIGAPAAPTRFAFVVRRLSN